MVGCTSRFVGGRTLHPQPLQQTISDPAATSSQIRELQVDDAVRRRRALLRPSEGRPSGHILDATRVVTIFGRRHTLDATSSHITRGIQRLAIEHDNTEKITFVKFKWHAYAIFFSARICTFITSVSPPQLQNHDHLIDISRSRRKRPLCFLRDTQNEMRSAMRCLRSRAYFSIRCPSTPPLS